MKRLFYQAHCQSCQNIALGVTFMIVTIGALSSCDKAPIDPRQHRIEICADCPSWQQQLGDDAQQLTPEEQRLLSNFIERRQYQLTHFGTTKPPSNVFIEFIQKDDSTSTKVLLATALVEQRRYERKHPFNPTGKPLTLTQRYPITVLAIPTTNVAPATSKPHASPLADAVPYPQRWQLSLSNLGSGAIKTFSGSIVLSQTISSSEQHSKPVITVPLTQFVPPIPPNKAGEFVVDVPKEVISQMTVAQLNHPDDILFKIKEGGLTLENGKKIKVTEQTKRP